MVGPEDGGSPVFQRCGEDLTGEGEGEEEEEAGDGRDILQLYITGMRLTNGDVGGYLPPGGPELRLPNGGVGERPPCACHRQCCSSDSQLPESSSPASAPPPPGSSSSSDSSPLSAHTVAGYFVSAEADRFRFLDVTRGSRNTFEVSRRQSAPDHLDDGLSLPEGGPGAQEQDGERPWRMGIADFFTRNFFSKRSKDLKSPGLSAPGWKLFGKVPPRENVQKDNKIIQQVVVSVAAPYSLGYNEALWPHPLKAVNGGETAMSPQR